MSPQCFSLRVKIQPPKDHVASTKANLGNTYAKGNKHSAATKAKISAAMKGKPKTAAHKAKMSGNTNAKKCTAVAEAKVPATKKRRVW